MPANKPDVEAYSIELDEESRTGINARLKDSGLALEALYLSQICLAAHFTTLDAGDKDAITREPLAHFLRGLGDLVSIYGTRLPILAVIQPEPTYDHEEYWKTRAGDQDWHRGDFSLQVMAETSIKNKLYNILNDQSGLEVAPFSYNPEDRPKSIEAFTLEVSETTDIPKRQRNLLTILQQALDQGESPSKAIEGWTERIAEEAGY